MNEKERLNLEYTIEDLVQIIKRGDVAKFKIALGHGDNKTAILTHAYNDGWTDTTALEELIGWQGEGSEIGKLECLKILIDEIGVDFIYAKNDKGDSLLHVAADRKAVYSLDF